MGGSLFLSIRCTSSNDSDKRGDFFLLGFPPYLEYLLLSSEVLVPGCDVSERLVETAFTHCDLLKGLSDT